MADNNCQPCEEKKAQQERQKACNEAIEKFLKDATPREKWIACIILMVIIGIFIAVIVYFLKFSRKPIQTIPIVQAPTTPTTDQAAVIPPPNSQPIAHQTQFITNHYLGKETNNPVMVHNQQHQGQNLNEINSNHFRTIQKLRSHYEESQKFN